MKDEESRAAQRRPRRDREKLSRPAHAARRRSPATEPRVLLATALEMARLVNEALARAGHSPAAVVGEARRGVELVDGLSMIASGPAGAGAVARALEVIPACRSIAVDREGDVRLRFEGGGPAVLRVVPRERFLEAVVVGSGSPSHVRWLETRAKRVGGLAAACLRARSEEALYASLGLPYAPAELRDRPTPHVPELVREVRGVFHAHTNWSDGSASILEMARAAARAGFGYLGITDHSKAAVYARGLDAARLRAQAAEMAEARRRAPEVLLFHGVEVDILADGSLDLDDATLARLDFVIASVHDAMDMTRRQMTDRLVRAVSHPLVTILGHPTGRLLLGRAGYAFDIDAVSRAAAANGTLLEINANPQRLDLRPALVRRAAELGARFAVDPDAHTPVALRDTSLGLMVARRAGLEPSRVFNAAGPREVRAFLAARRRQARAGSAGR